MKDFLIDLLKKMIAQPDALAITRDENNETITLNITAHADDCGGIIGKKGKTINALRTLLYLYLHKKELPEKHSLKIILHVNS